MFNVYKLSCNKTGQDYYGSTEETVERRLQGHKDNYKSFLEGTGKTYCTSYEIIKNGNYKIELLDECDNIYHMIERETFYFDNFECVNIRRPAVPGRTKKEYYETFKVEISEKAREYYHANKEIILEKWKEKYICVCGSSITKQGKSQHEQTIKHKKYLENLKHYFNKWKKLILKKS